MDDDVDIENWDYSSSDDPDICDLILTTDGGDLQAVRAIRKKYEHHHLPWLIVVLINLFTGYKKQLVLALKQPLLH